MQCKLILWLTLLMYLRTCMALEQLGVACSKFLDTVKGKKKKVQWSRYRPGVAHRVGRGIALLFHNRGTRSGWVVSSTPRPHFTLGKTRYPFYRRLGEPQGQSGRAENLDPTGIRSRTVRPVVAVPTELLGPHLDTVACSKYLDTVAGAPRFHVFISFFRYKEHAKRDDGAVLFLKGEMVRYVAAVHVWERWEVGRTDGPSLKVSN